MNRIILIGNGFDLAHGMKTSYNDFLKDYWKNTNEKIRESKLNEPFENEDIIIDRSPAGFLESSELTYENLKYNIKSFKANLKFKNRFLEKISEKSSLQKWVDIENEYYNLLIESYDSIEIINLYKIEELNKDFNRVKELLNEYLIKIENEPVEIFYKRNLRTRQNIGHKIYNPFKLKDFSEVALNQKAELEYSRLKNDIEAIKNKDISYEELNDVNKKIIQKIGLSDPINGLKKLLQSESAINYFDLIPDSTLFLNFNYTFTDSMYHDPQEFDQFNKQKYTSVKSIHIHGSTDKLDKNPMVFGFGDELDNRYKSIEKLNKNEYLENIKSIKYLDTDNYKKLLEFINSGNFQIFLFGHSCGISDRTLLNTVFEHENCSSIKLFFYQKDGKNDNFSDIVRNISRNFNDKAKMRDRVVNKNYSEPLD